MLKSTKRISKLCLGVAISGLLFSSYSFAQITCTPYQYVDRDGNEIYGPPTGLGVVPELCTGLRGDAGQQCVVSLGYDFGLKVDDWDQNTDGGFSGACDDHGSCELADEFNTTITITGNDGYNFDWDSFPFNIDAVAVKGGTESNLFSYDPSSSSDTDLYAPLNSNNGKMRGVSHAAFCWNKSDNPDSCYEEETAWAVGTGYNSRRGNWAMFVDYQACDDLDGVRDGNCTTRLRADGGDGIGIDVGTAMFRPAGPGEVELRISLEGGAIFYYDLADEELDNNLKVQDYASPPKGNPKIGRFDYKISEPIGSTAARLILPANNYYGVHLDVAVLAPCD